MLEDFNQYTEDIEIDFNGTADIGSAVVENKSNIVEANAPPWNEFLLDKTITGNALTLGGATAFAAGVVGLNYLLSSKLKEREEKRKRFQYNGK